MVVFWLESPENIPVQSRIKDKERLQKIFQSKLRLRTNEDNTTLGQFSFQLPAAYQMRRLYSLRICKWENP